MKTKIATLGLSVLLLAACGSQDKPSDSTPPAPTALEAQENAQSPAEPSVVTETVTQTVAQTVTQTVTARAAEPKPEPEPEPAPTSFESAFGDKAHFTQGSGSHEVQLAITVGQPTEADCRYRSLGCDAPETGDRVISVPLIIENLGDSQVEASSQMFEIEFADGTRLSDGDGVAREYSSDADLSYSRMIRPGGTINTSLTFEAPEGEFGIVLMTNSYNGEDLHIWLGS
jgi:hypothetical protein